MTADIEEMIREVEVLYGYNPATKTVLALARLAVEARDTMVDVSYEEWLDRFDALAARAEGEEETT